MPTVVLNSGRRRRTGFLPSKHAGGGFTRKMGKRKTTGFKPRKTLPRVQFSTGKYRRVVISR